MLTRGRILDLIPHAGAMCLLDHVVEWDQSGIHCRSDSRAGPSHPLRHDDRVAMVHLIEYGAQAAALHAGLMAREAGVEAVAGGYLAGLRDVVLTEQQIDVAAAVLDVYARQQAGGPQGMIYHFEVMSAGVSHCSGRLTVMNTT